MFAVIVESIDAIVVFPEIISINRLDFPFVGKIISGQQIGSIPDVSPISAQLGVSLFRSVAEGVTEPHAQTASEIQLGVDVRIVIKVRLPAMHRVNPEVAQIAHRHPVMAGYGKFELDTRGEKIDKIRLFVSRTRKYIAAEYPVIFQVGRYQHGSCRMGDPASP